MSSRQLRRIQQQRELELAKLHGQTSESEGDLESEEESVVQQKAKPSLFANLAVLEDEVNDDSDEENTQPEESKDRDPPATPAANKTSRPKKKKKKTKGKAKTEDREDERHGEDEIEAALKELNIRETSIGRAAETANPLDSQYERICALLGINTNHLKVANEMRSLFGKDAVEDNDDAGGAIGSAARRAHRRQRNQPRQVDLETALKGHHKPGQGLSELTLRRNHLIQGKDEWPKATTGGLTMAVVDDKAADGTVEFRFVHDSTYQSLQQTYHQMVEMGDPQNLIALLTRNPYHISLLLQVSKIAKDQGDHALSADLLERALFTFGRAATSLFNTKLSQGKARIDFARPENREVWLAGYHYIKTLVMKGTYRTAFEWAKLLLSIGPEEDSYCMRLVLHKLALKAREPKWLLEFYETASNSIWPAVEGSSRVYMSPSLTLASVQLKDPIKSREHLSKAMESIPWLFTRLFKEINLDAPKSIWGVMPRTDAEIFFAEIYVLQTKDHWNTPELTSLLMEVAHTISKPNLDSLPLLKNSEMNLDVVRHIYLDNNTKLMSLVPSALLHRSNNSDSDPLPPDHNIFSYPAQQRAVQGGERGLDFGPDDFNDPMAALARLWGTGPAGDAVLAREVQREIERAAGSGEGDEVNDNDLAQGEQRPNWARRLMEMLWARGGTNEGDAGNERSNADDDEHPNDVDIDMPGAFVAGDGEPSDSEENRQMRDILAAERARRQEREHPEYPQLHVRRNQATVESESDDDVPH